jgi:uncharacterized protein (TIGR03089 family)
MPTPSAVLAALLRSDPARPRITCYDDTPGPTRGERIELSAKVLANWVNKAANALQEDWDVEPGTTVRLSLPPHWRSCYWALAVWSVGGTVVVGDDEVAEYLVTDDPALADASTVPTALVTLAALARSAAQPVPDEVMDEARELATFADQFSPWQEPEPGDLAMAGDGGDLTYDEVVPRVDWPAGVRVHTREDDLATLLRHALAAWSLDGSLVLSRGPVPEGGDDARLAAEGVTLAIQP